MQRRRPAATVPAFREVHARGGQNVPDLRFRKRSFGRPRTRRRGCANGLSSEDLDGFLVPRSDQHQGEYVAPGSERLRWLTGFAGSAGVALILRERAHIFVDGRYTLQVRSQVDLSIFTVESLVETPPPAWIGKNLGKGARIGFDPWLHTIADAKALRAAAEKDRRDAGAGRRAIRSTSCGPTGRRRRSPRSRSTRSSMPANSPGTGWPGLPPCSPRRAPPTPCSPTRRRSPGPSTSAAMTCRTRRWRWPSPCCRPKGRICFSSTSASSASRPRPT